jgi:glutamine synthetase
MIPVLAIAGSLARKKYTPPGVGTLPTHNTLFVVLLVGAVLAVLRAGLTSLRPLPPPVEGDPARLGEAAPARLPPTLAEASTAFAASQLLREAMGEPLHSTLVASQQAELRRCAALDPEQLIASTRWYPLVGA